MAEWKKVVVSGSSAELGGLTVTNTITGAITGDAGGNAATATALETARNIGGVSFDGTGNIDLPGVNTAGNQNTSGNAATATALATARDLQVSLGSTSAASFDGSGNASIGVTGQLAPGNGGTGLTSIATLLNSNVTATDVGLGNVTNESKATMFTSPSFTGTATAAALTVTGDLSVAGTASFNNTTNLSVADKYILLNSGSEGANQDSGGIVIQGASGTSGLGALFGYASGSANSVSTRRWAVNSSFDADTGGDFTPEAFMSTVILSSVEGSTDQDAVAAQYKKPGNIFVDESNGIPYIYV